MAEKRDPFKKPKFVDAIKHVIKHETEKYVVFPKAGGETKYGITKKAYPELDIKNLTQEKALEIYEKDYWDKIKGEALPRKTSKVVMDSAVLSGQPTAVKMLQQIVGVRPDGNMGEKTLQATLNYAAEHGDDALAKRINAQRKQRLRSLAKARKFGRGWIKRVEDLED